MYGPRLGVTKRMLRRTLDIEKIHLPASTMKTPPWKVSEDTRACSAALACNTSMHDILCGAN